MNFSRFRGAEQTPARGAEQTPAGGAAPTPDAAAQPASGGRPAQLRPRPTGDDEDAERLWDVIVIGSGFGGAFAALPLVRAGLDVLMLERGDRVERGASSWEVESSLEHSRHWFPESARRAGSGRGGGSVGALACVGGASVFYGGVALRFRERDFDPAPEIVGVSGAAWPLEYGELEPYYARAERWLGVAGQAGRDPTEPARSGPYPQPAPELSETSGRIADAARSLGLRPFPLPLAIQYEPEEGRSTCVRCARCDMFACAIGAKNDLAATLLPALEGEGLRLRTGEAARRLRVEGRRVTGVECVERRTGRVRVRRARHYVVAAGALATPQLLLASGVETQNPAGALVGRFLMRHCSAITFGVFPRPIEPDRFHKQVGLTDFYFGHPENTPGRAGGRKPFGKLGSLQQLQTPTLRLVQKALPRPARPLVGPLVRRATGLLAIAEDRPRPENRVVLAADGTDAFGLPRMMIHHRYGGRDLAARRALLREAGRILRRAGALSVYVHRIDTFSHAVGTVRMGQDPERAPIDSEGRFRGIHNLRVSDASVFPTSAGVNPSLTIAACALRIGERLAQEG